jgi:hypothetical protein
MKIIFVSMVGLALSSVPLADEIVDMKAKHLGARFRTTSPRPRYGISVAGATLIKYVHDRSELVSPSNWHVEVAMPRSGEDPSLFVDAVSLLSDGTLNIFVIPDRNASYLRRPQVNLQRGIKVSFLVGGQVYTHGTADNDEFLKKAGTLRYSEALSFTASTSSASDQKLLLLKTQIDPDVKDLQRFDLKGTLKGAKNPFRAFFNATGYDELGLAVVGSTERRDPKSRLELSSTSIGSSILPIPGGVGVTEIIARTSQAFASYDFVVRSGTRFVYTYKHPTGFTVFNDRSQTKQPPSNLPPVSEVNMGASAAYQEPRVIPFVPLDDLLSQSGIIEPALELGATIKGNPEFKEPRRHSGIGRGRIRFQTPRVSIGGERFFANATSNVYYLPFKNYGGSAKGRQVEANFEIATYFKFNKDSALKIAFGGGANPQSQFEWVKPVVSFGIAGGF